MSNYQEELIQLAAVALCMAQIDRVGDTRRNTTTGFRVEQELLDEIKRERGRQEEKWGTRHEKDAPRSWWYTVLGEEFGEVGRAILEARAK